MNILYFFINLPYLGILSFIIYPSSNSNNNNNINLCKNCKYFLPNTFLMPNYEFAKCSFFKKITPDENYLVTGEIKKDKIEYKYCSICRKNEDMCGINGKEFISKYKK